MTEQPTLSPSLGVSVRSAASGTVQAPSDPGIALLCSARGCHEVAVWGLRWNNPKLHVAEKRKTWLACAEHRESLSTFLSARGFLRETIPVGQLRPDA